MDPCLPRYCLGHQGFASARSAHEYDTLWNAGPKGNEFLRLLEELDNLVQFLFRLFNASYVIKGDCRFLAGEHARAALPKEMAWLPLLCAWRKMTRKKALNRTSARTQLRILSNQNSVLGAAIEIDTSRVCSSLAPRLASEVTGMYQVLCTMLPLHFHLFAQIQGYRHRPRSISVLTIIDLCGEFLQGYDFRQRRALKN